MGGWKRVGLVRATSPEGGAAGFDPADRLVAGSELQWGRRACSPSRRAKGVTGIRNCCAGVHFTQLGSGPRRTEVMEEFEINEPLTRRLLQRSRRKQTAAVVARVVALLLAGCGDALGSHDAVTGAGAGGSRSGSFNEDSNVAGEGGTQDDSRGSEWLGLWEAIEQERNPCEDEGSGPATRLVRLRRRTDGALELARLALDVPDNEVRDPGYEECVTTLDVVGQTGSAPPYFCSPRRLNASGIPTDALQVSIVEDKFSLNGAQLHERRVNSADVGYGRHDCAGTFEVLYRRSERDDSVPLEPSPTLDVGRHWRAVQRDASGLPFVEMELALEQAGTEVKAQYLLGETVYLYLRGRLRGTHFDGWYNTSLGPDQKPVRLDFSADGTRFNGSYGERGIWQGVW
jgi:hypothetical protein